MTVETFGNQKENNFMEVSRVYSVEDLEYTQLNTMPVALAR